LTNSNDSSSYFERDQNFQEKCNIEYLLSLEIALHSMEKFGNSLVYIFPRKTLNFNNNLEEFQKTQLIKMIQKHSFTYAWEYIDMKGIDLKHVCIIFTSRKMPNHLENLKEG